MADSTEKNRFSSRLGLILVTLGMAIGAGNIWRFPRIAAKNGGGAFLVPWLLFMILWSAPLLMVEFAMGKATRQGPIGAFVKALGGKFAWAGAFVALCTAFIMFYYSVVTGWSAYYALASLTRFHDLTHRSSAVWNHFSNGSLQAVFFHGLASLGSALILARGVTAGIERVSKVLVPLLGVLLVAAMIRGLTLPGGPAGLQFLYHVDWDRLADGRTWIEALTQSAWSTGAGWGLMLTYGAYASDREDVGLNSLITVLGNNSASLLAAMAVLPAVFALAGSGQEAAMATGAGNTGLAFVWMPRLFGRMSAAGPLFAFIFFAALTAAALSSLLAMMEMVAKVVMDMGLTRHKALTLVGGATFLFGLPSALNLHFFENQDWVWGLGLLLSGGLVAMAAIRLGPRAFRKAWINGPGADWQVGPWFDLAITWIIPIQLLVLLAWWFTQSITTYAPHSWYKPWDRYSLATCLVQWTAAFAILVFLGGRLARRIQRVARQRGEPERIWVDQRRQAPSDDPTPQGAPTSQDAPMSQDAATESGTSATRHDEVDRP